MREVVWCKSRGPIRDPLRRLFRHDPMEPRNSGFRESTDEKLEGETKREGERSVLMDPCAKVGQEGRA
jgi:hypothetical protein